MAFSDASLTSKFNGSLSSYAPRDNNFTPSFTLLNIPASFITFIVITCSGSIAPLFIAFNIYDIFTSFNTSSLKNSILKKNNIKNYIITSQPSYPI